MKQIGTIHPGVTIGVTLRFKEREINAMIVQQIQQSLETTSKDAFTEEAKAIILAGQYHLTVHDDETTHETYVDVCFTVDEGAASDG